MEWNIKITTNTVYNWWLIKNIPIVERQELARSKGKLENILHRLDRIDGILVLFLVMTIATSTAAID